MNPAIDCIMSRLSVRQFTGAPVSPADLETLLRAGMAAPSAVNVQPWSFMVVTDRTLLDQLCAALPYAKMLDRAGAAIIVCGLPDKDTQIAPKYWMVDCAAATQNILLAAHALGYGAVWTAVWPEAGRMDAVRTLCNLPGNVVPLNVLPIGVPASKNQPAKDKYRADLVHRNTWQQP